MRWFAKRGSQDGPGVKLRPPAEPVRVRRVRGNLPEIEPAPADPSLPARDTAPSAPAEQEAVTKS